MTCHHLFADDMQRLCCGSQLKSHIWSRVLKTVSLMTAPGVRQNDSSLTQIRLKSSGLAQPRTCENCLQTSWTPDWASHCQSVVKPVTTVRNLGVLINADCYRCATTSRDWRRRAFFTYAVYAQCVISSAKTSRNDWFALSCCHDSTTVMQYSLVSQHRLWHCSRR